MPEIQGQITAVTPRQTNTGKTVYDIEFSNGKTYATFKQNLATEARNLVGQTVVAEVTEKLNGQYTNYYWERIVSMWPGATAAYADAVADQTIRPVSTVGPSDKDVQIARAVALKAAVDLVTAGTPNPDVVTELAAALEPYLLGAVKERPVAAGTPWDES